MGYHFTNPTDNNTFFAEFAEAAKLTEPGLKTTDAESGQYRLGVTIYGVSDIMQGAASFKSVGLTLGRYNQISTQSLADLVNSQGGEAAVLGGSGPITPYDYLQRTLTGGANNISQTAGGVIDPDNPAGTGGAGASGGSSGGSVASILAGNPLITSFHDLSGVEEGGVYTLGDGSTLVTKKYKGTELAKEVIGSYKAMFDAAAAVGISLAGGGFRNQQEQINLRIAHCGGSDHYSVYERPSGDCHPPTARPGHSNHERGLAFDANNCPRGSAKFNWLKAHAAEYGWKNLPSESWHWSANGN